MLAEGQFGRNFICFVEDKAVVFSLFYCYTILQF